MKRLLSEERGITIITITTMVIVILVILSVFTFYARNSVKMESFEGMKADIKEIESKALLYNVDTNALPITSVDDKVSEFNFGDWEFRNPNDSGNYYKVDVNKIGVTKAYNTEYYINETTLTVYAETPILLNGKNYGRFKEEFDKFGVEEIVLPTWSLQVPADMFTYDDESWITGFNEDFMRSHRGDPRYTEYFADEINIRNLIIPAYSPSGSPVVGIRGNAFSNGRQNINGSMKIPPTIKKVEGGILRSGSNLTYIYCDAVIIDVNTFKGNGFIQVSEVVIGPHCQMPDGDIQNGGVFSDLQNIRKVIIEGTSIGKYAFSGRCDAINDIYLLGAIEELPEGAFMNGRNGNHNFHTNLESTAQEVVFPESLLRIGKNCFNGCSLRNVVLPPSLIEIEENAFANMNNTLQSVILNDNLKKIGKRAFYGDGNLRTISHNGVNGRFNPALEEIGDEAFRGCDNNFPRTIYIPRTTVTGTNCWPNNRTIRTY